MLEFETLTLAPIDLDMVDESLLTAPEKGWLNRYHADVRAAIAPPRARFRAPLGRELPGQRPELAPRTGGCSSATADPGSAIYHRTMPLTPEQVGREVGRIRVTPDARWLTSTPKSPCAPTRSG